MLKKVRKKVASSVSKIEYTDYYEFSKWLRIPSLTHFEFGELTNEYVPKHIQITELEIPITQKLKFQFAQNKLLPTRDKLVMKRAKAALVFFTIAKPNNISLKNKLLIPDEEIVRKNFVIDITVKVTPFNFSITVPSTKQIEYTYKPTGDYTKIIDYSIKQPSVNSYSLLVSPPLIEDKLAELVPKVYEIELLNEQLLTVQNLINLTHYIIDISNLPAPDVKRYLIPGIDDLTTRVISYKPERLHPSTITEVKISSDIKTAVSKAPKLDFKKTTTKVLKFTKTSPTSIKIKNPLDDKSSSVMDRKIIKHILTGSVKATWEKTRKVIPDLQPHQEEGAKFLTENSFTVMAEEPGSDKQIQVIGALKFLFNTKQIKSALVIIKHTRLGNIEHSRKFRVQEGLLGRLVVYAPEISLNIISADSSEDPNHQASTTIISYRNHDELTELIENATSGKSYDLVLVDEFTDAFNSNSEIEKLFRKFYPDYFWMLTGQIITENYKENFKEGYLPEGKTWNYYVRTADDLSGKIPPVKYENVWFEPDGAQVEEYKQLIDSNRDDLKQVIDSLNPFKFQSTVFSLIHKIKQISNFSSTLEDSPKSRFLLDQLKITALNKKRTLLFTQYDSLGLKRLEKILEKEKIRYLSVQNGSSPEDLRRALSMFYSRDDYPIFMTNLKPARIKADLKKISYIINFDQWWNPSLHWQTEEDLGLENHTGSPVVFYNYLMANSFDEVISDILESKSLTNKELFGELNTESLAELINEYDWQEIFELGKDIPDRSENISFIRNTLSKITVDDFSELMKKLFMRLGYRDIEVIELQDEPSMYVLGRSGKLRSSIEFRAKCILAKSVDTKDWEEILEQEPNKAKYERLFVISTGIIKKPSTTIKRNVNFIDGERLINLINLLSLITKDSLKLRRFDEEE